MESSKQRNWNDLTFSNHPQQREQPVPRSGGRGIEATRASWQEQPVRQTVPKTAGRGIEATRPSWATQVLQGTTPQPPTMDSLLAAPPPSLPQQPPLLAAVQQQQQQQQEQQQQQQPLAQVQTPLLRQKMQREEPAFAAAGDEDPDIFRYFIAHFPCPRKGPGQKKVGFGVKSRLAEGKPPHVIVVRPEGAMAEYNARCAQASFHDDVVCVGDEILEVNGVVWESGEDPLMKKLGEDEMLFIVLRRQRCSMP